MTQEGKFLLYAAMLGVVAVIGWALWQVVSAVLGDLVFVARLAIFVVPGLALVKLAINTRGKIIEQNKQRNLLYPDENGYYPIQTKVTPAEQTQQVMPPMAVPKTAQIKMVFGAGATAQPALSAPEAPALLLPQLPRATRSFMEILSEVRPDHLFLGFNRQGEAIWANDISQLLHSALIGLSQRGKTSYERLHATQFLTLGWRPVFFDGHGDITQFVKAYFPDDCYWTTSMIEEGAKKWLAEMKSRLERHAANKSRTKLVFERDVLFTDEWHRIYEDCPTLVELESKALAESAKVNILTFVAGQSLPAYMFGKKGSGARDIFGSKFALASSDRQARMIGLEGPEVESMLKELLTAPQGTLIAATTATFPDLIATPYCTVEVMEYAAQKAGFREVGSVSYSLPGTMTTALPDPAGNARNSLETLEALLRSLYEVDLASPVSLPPKQGPKVPYSSPLGNARIEDEAPETPQDLTGNAEPVSPVSPPKKIRDATPEEEQAIIRLRYREKKAARDIPGAMGLGMWFYPNVTKVLERLEGPLSRKKEEA